MKYKNLCLLYFCLILSSCGIFAKYGALTPYSGGWHEDYERLLTPDQLDQLKLGKEVFFKAELYDAKGYVRAIPVKNSHLINYIEIGNWYQEFLYKGPNGKSKVGIYLKSETIYDSLGNYISKKDYEKRDDQNQFILREETSLYQEGINGKVYNLHNTKAYYDTGELMVDGWHRNLDFDEPKSHMMKKLIRVKFLKKYDKSGKLKSHKIFDLDGNKI